MTCKQVEEMLTELVHREPFVPFVVDLLDGQSLIVAQPPVFDETGAGYFDPNGYFGSFEFSKVRSIQIHTTEHVA